MDYSDFTFPKSPCYSVWLMASLSNIELETKSILAYVLPVNPITPHYLSWYKQKSYNNNYFIAEKRDLLCIWLIAHIHTGTLVQ